jgi:hypothetical protein
MTSIGDSAFRSCSSLDSITLPDSLTSIGRYVFEGCNAITFYATGNGKAKTMANGKVLIFDGVILHWLAAKTGAIVIPEGVTDIGSHFYMSGITSISLPDSLTSIGSEAFYSCRSLTTIHLPDSLTSIGLDAFRSCSSLTTIHLPDSLTSIGSEAFSSCAQLTRVDLPDTLTSIGFQAFAFCNSLNTAIIRNATPPAIPDYLYYNIFHSSGITQIYVPDESVDLYKSTPMWSEYAAKIKGLSELPL